jgi:hypothetical protein
MNATRAIFLAAILASGVLLASGCASTQPQDDVSSIPWDRPQQWEGAGALGGFRPSAGGTGN